MLPLSGVKVVDMAQIFLGPGAAVYLADQGAEVIKVEPLQGDTMRTRHTSPYLEPLGFSKPFLALNRNKRDVVLDIRNRECQDIAHRLARWADVFILNFRPGAEARVRLDYGTLAAINPRLIYAAISGFGAEGPEANLPGYDIVIQARSGILSTRRNADGMPIPSVVMIADMSGCASLAYGIAVALLDREKTGKGQRVDISLFHSALAMQMQQMVWVKGDRSPLPGQQSSALYSCYPCADEQLINIVVIEEHQWKALCRVLGLEHLAEDPRFGSYELRLHMATELFAILDAMFRLQPCHYWLERLKAEGVPCSAVVERDDVPDDPQTVANEMFWEQEHPVVGPVKMVSPPVRLSGARDEPHLRRPAPRLGEHTGEVLRELGYDEATIARLRGNGAII